MTGRIKDLLKGFEGLGDKYISQGCPEPERGTYNIAPTGHDAVAKRYTDGGCIRRFRFKISTLQAGGRDEDNLGYMQSISDYLQQIEYPDDTIIGFEQVSPPVVEKRGASSVVYTFVMECIYAK